MARMELNQTQFPGYKNTAELNQYYPSDSHYTTRMASVSQLNRLKSGDFPKAASIGDVSNEVINGDRPKVNSRLMQSIASKGVQEPISLNHAPTVSKKQFELDDGHHRFAGAREAGHRKVPVSIKTEHAKKLVNWLGNYKPPGGY